MSSITSEDQSVPHQNRNSIKKRKKKIRAPVQTALVGLMSDSRKVGFNLMQFDEIRHLRGQNGN